MSILDNFKIMARLGEAKTKINELKEKLPFIEITEESPDGLIRITISADKVIRQLDINENMLLPAAKTDLEQRLKEAINAAIIKADLLYKEELKKTLEGVVPEIPGFDMGSLMSKL
jgi:nucleoid-associated protein EbfC